MRISLVPREIIDVGGFSVRLREDIRQLKLPKAVLNGPEKPEGFQDWGLVWCDDIEYFMSSYNPPVVDEI